MNPAAASISEMYHLQGEAFEDRFRTKATNIRRSLLEEFIRAPLSDADDNLDTQGRLLVIAQKEIANAANLTDDQADDFAARLDNVVADAILIIRKWNMKSRHLRRTRLDCWLQSHQHIVSQTIVCVTVGKQRKKPQFCVS